MVKVIWFKLEKNHPIFTQLKLQIVKWTTRLSLINSLMNAENIFAHYFLISLSCIYSSTVCEDFLYPDFSKKFLS